ncbi:uncharacterized Golgi apparatus membrane protein-like protein CG5021 [Diabrotica virgifera virgifera]|uniref:Golgi apparatus membrane protein TVP23 homolog n=1 Tax=Diabrotica virgifera virgifera TaxID=50390 RepID=A0A6P7GVQ5_DIAVI|nr:uncharacterized Golgi apparatus membrane protein-like protein CG5021 [Diabrotica virgifera virgifera]
MSSASMPLLEDTTAFGEDEGEFGVKKDALAHPYITFFHLAFRGAAIVAYLLCEQFTASFITSFVSVILLLSMDFWTVKNITGRLMVGLRWWNYVDEDGKSHWVFESRQNKVNEREARIFWVALVLTPLLWSFLFIVGLFGFEFRWLLLVTIALILTGSNLYGYVRCKVGNKESVSSLTSDFLRRQVLQNAVSLMTRQPPAQPAPSQSNLPTNVV